MIKVIYASKTKTYDAEGLKQAVKKYLEYVADQAGENSGINGVEIKSIKVSKSTRPVRFDATVTYAFKGLTDNYGDAYSNTYFDVPLNQEIPENFYIDNDRYNDRWNINQILNDWGAVIDDKNTKQLGASLATKIKKLAKDIAKDYGFTVDVDTSQLESVSDYHIRVSIYLKNIEVPSNSEFTYSIETSNVYGDPYLNIIDPRTGINSDDISKTIWLFNDIELKAEDLSDISNSELESKIVNIYESWKEEIKHGEDRLKTEVKLYTIKNSTTYKHDTDQIIEELQDAFADEPVEFTSETRKLSDEFRITISLGKYTSILEIPIEDVGTVNINKIIKSCKSRINRLKQKYQATERSRFTSKTGEI